MDRKGGKACIGKALTFHIFSLYASYSFMRKSRTDLQVFPLDSHALCLTHLSRGTLVDRSLGQPPPGFKGGHLVLPSILSFIFLFYFFFIFFWLSSFFFLLFFFIFKLSIIVLVLPNIKMNPPQVYMCSPS